MPFTRVELGSWLRREALVALAAGVVAALVVAAALTYADTAGHRYWATGYRRLVAGRFAAHFDAWAAGLGGGALAVAAGWGAVRGGRAGSGLVRVAALGLVVVLAARMAAAVDAWRVRGGPNVVLISIDTLRADALGAYGQPRPTSPVLDARLAGAGVVFERCYSQSPKTTPSHMTLLTSLEPPVHGVEMWDGKTPGRVLHPAAVTLAEALENAGYATAAFTGGGHVHRSRGFGDGFDIYRHGRELERALAWLDAHRRHKFFLFFHTYQVHDPYVPPEPLVERFAPDYRGRVRDAVTRLRAGLDGGWERAHKVFWASVDGDDPRDVAFVAGLYLAGVRHMDDTTLTPLLDRLDALGLAGDTLVVLTSDHGEAFREHGVFLHDDLYAETLRVPLVLRFPGRLPAGASVPERVRVLDVMPTILDLLGIPPPPDVQGRSLVPLVRGTRTRQPVMSDYSNTQAKRVFQSLRDDRLTYIVDGAAEQLYDTAADPAEQQDVAAERPTEVASARARLARWREQCRPLATRLAPQGNGVEPDADTLGRLRALGYVE
jgi:arylsulfatase A-like enzyme